MHTHHNNYPIIHFSFHFYMPVFERSELRLLHDTKLLAIAIYI